MIAVQSPGSVMVLKTMKTRLMDVISLAMIMMVEIVAVAVIHIVVMVPVMAMKLQIAALKIAAVVAVTVMRDMLKTVPVMATAVQSPGLAMALKIVKIRPGVVTLHALTMTAVTALVAEAVVVKTVMTVNMTLPRTALYAVILPGMNMVLIVRP